MNGQNVPAEYARPYPVPAGADAAAWLRERHLQALHFARRDNRPGRARKLERALRRGEADDALRAGAARGLCGILQQRRPDLAWEVSTGPGGGTGAEALPLHGEVVGAVPGRDDPHAVGSGSPAIADPDNVDGGA